MLFIPLYCNGFSFEIFDIDTWMDAKSKIKHSISTVTLYRYSEGRDYYEKLTNAGIIAKKVYTENIE